MSLLNIEVSHVPFQHYPAYLREFISATGCVRTKRAQPIDAAVQLGRAEHFGDVHYHEWPEELSLQDGNFIV